MYSTGKSMASSHLTHYRSFWDDL